MHFHYCLIAWLVGLKISHAADTDIKQDCGRTKGCLYKPDGCTPFVDCSYFFSYSTKSEKNDTVVMELLAKLKGPEIQYVAVGFSHDTSMGDDAVTYCIYDPEKSKHAAGLSFNVPNGKDNRVVSDPAALGHVVLESSTVLDGNFLCRISQKLRPDFKSDQVRNLDSGDYILLASGPATLLPNKLRAHVFNQGDPRFPFISGSQINVAQFTPNITVASVVKPTRCVSQSTGFNLVKAHGILMIFGWLLFVAMAVLIARYFRTLLAEKELFGSAIWFNLHRALNICGVLLIVAAFICIFVKTCGVWSGGDRTYNHAVLGMTASICAFAQPIIAFLRCHPGESGRWIFNWIHRTIGVSALGCACAAIWFASNFNGLGLNPNDIDGNGSAGKGMIIFYFVSIICLILALELLITLAERLKSNRVSEGEGANHFRVEPLKTTNQGILNYNVWNLSRIALLTVFFVIAIAVCVTLACFIGLA